MEIEFDPAKDALNVKKHGISLARAVDMDPIEYIDDSAYFDELRYRLIGYIDDRLHVLAAVDRDNVQRAISLRKANKIEVKRYEQD